MLPRTPGGVEGVPARTHQWWPQPDARWGKLDHPGQDLYLTVPACTNEIHCLVWTRCVDFSV